MYNYAAAGALFDGISNVYLLSTATVFLAVIIALYLSNFLKDDSKHEKPMAEEGPQAEEQIPAQVDQQDAEEVPNNSGAQQQEATDKAEAVDELLGKNNAEGLVGKMKSAILKDLEAELTPEQLEEERRIEREQMTAIYALLKTQEAELNMREMDPVELSAQLKLYR